MGSVSHSHPAYINLSLHVYVLLDTPQVGIKARLPVKHCITANRLSFYVWDLDKDKGKPLILVLEHQVDQLLAEINSALRLQLQITSQQREGGLVGRFPDHPRCLPRYLGRSTSRKEFDDMATNVPAISYRRDGEGAAPPQTLEEFKKMMADMDEIQKKKNKIARKQKMQERFIKQKSMADQFKRAQRYLGLRPSAQGGEWIISSDLS